MAILLERHGSIALITINNPERLNALSFGTLDELDNALEKIQGWDVRALVITGAGTKAFCAGADITELVGRTMNEVRDGTLRGQATMSRLETFRVPSVALVNGLALGGGLELALACTFRLATPNARLGLPEVRLGLVPGYGGTQRLSRLVGLGIALEYLLSGKMMPADEAVRLGLVNKMLGVERTLDEALEFCGEFTRNSLSAIRLVRDAVLRGCRMSLEEGLRLEADISALSYQTADGIEGLQAFLEKRQAKFKDQ